MLEVTVQDHSAKSGKTKSQPDRGSVPMFCHLPSTEFRGFAAAWQGEGPARLS